MQDTAELTEAFTGLLFVFLLLSLLLFFGYNVHVKKKKVPDNTCWEGSLTRPLPSAAAGHHGSFGREGLLPVGWSSQGSSPQERVSPRVPLPAFLGAFECVV